MPSPTRDSSTAVAAPTAEGVPDAAPDDAAQAEVALDIRRIMWRTVIGIIVIVAVVFGSLLLFKDELTAISRVFVDTLGGPGIALGYALPDAFTIPLPNDAFTFFGYHAGMPFWEAVFWGSLGSLIGGAIGWCIGRLFQRTRAYRRIMDTRGREVTLLVKRYATITLLVASLTPIPYSLACWAVGAGGMRFSWFFLLSLTRIIKVTLYLYLITLGLVTF